MRMSVTPTYDQASGIMMVSRTQHSAAVRVSGSRRMPLSGPCKTRVALLTNHNFGAGWGPQDSWKWSNQGSETVLRTILAYHAVFRNTDFTSIFLVSQGTSINYEIRSAQHIRIVPELLNNVHRIHQVPFLNWKIRRNSKLKFVIFRT